MSHQHHQIFYNQQLYWRSHQKLRQTVSGITVVNINATRSFQLQHVLARVWIWITIITISIVYHNNMQYIMIMCTCYMTAMLLVGRRRRGRIGAPIAVSRASASSHAHNTPLVTGTPSSVTCGAAAANQHIHDFGGSRDCSPEWYPAGFRFNPPPEARARQHLLGDDGLAPHISRLVCLSFNVFYQGCFRRRKILKSARRLSEYLL